jgi:hypothetical protein
MDAHAKSVLLVVCVAGFICLGLVNAIVSMKLALEVKQHGEFSIYPGGMADWFKFWQTPRYLMTIWQILRGRKLPQLRRLAIKCVVVQCMMIAAFASIGVCVAFGAQ